MTLESSRPFFAAGLITAALAGGAVAVGAPKAHAQASTAQITVLYDAFGKTSTMKKDWGFSAYIEYGDKRILFDTGNNAEIFAHNVAAKGVDLAKLDFAIDTRRGAVLFGGGRHGWEIGLRSSPITRSGDARHARSQQSELGSTQSAAPHMRLAQALERRVRFGLKWAQELPRFGDC